MEQNDDEKTLIKKSMIISEVIAKKQGAVNILLQQGIHCVGCGASGNETLEQGLKLHGKTDQEIDGIVDEINKLAKPAAEAGLKSGNPSDDEPSPIAITITENAAEKLKSIIKDETKKKNADGSDSRVLGVRIRAVPGCGGFQYGMQLVEQKKQDDLEIEINNITLFIGKNEKDCSKGITIDYIVSPAGEGFVITNPNMAGCAGCF